MATLRIETDRGYGWQVRQEGEISDSITIDEISAQVSRMSLNGNTRAFLNGEIVAESAKLTAKQAKKIFGLP